MLRPTSITMSVLMFCKVISQPTKLDIQIENVDNAFGNNFINLNCDVMNEFPSRIILIFMNKDDLKDKHLVIACQAINFHL